jgi:hypothetical protein
VGRQQPLVHLCCCTSGTRPQASTLFFHLNMCVGDPYCVSVGHLSWFGGDLGAPLHSVDRPLRVKLWALPLRLACTKNHLRRRRWRLLSSPLLVISRICKSPLNTWTGLQLEWYRPTPNQRSHQPSENCLDSCAAQSHEGQNAKVF